MSTLFMSAPETSPEFDEILENKVGHWIETSMTTKELFALHGVREAMVLHFYDEIHKELSEEDCPDEVKSEVCRQFGKGETVSSLAKQIGVSEKIIHGWLKKEWG